MYRVIALIVIVIATSISAWALKVRVKRKMEEGLGRKVDDGELTSISAWMKVPEKHLPFPRNQDPDS